MSTTQTDRYRVPVQVVRAEPPAHPTPWVSGEALRQIAAQIRHLALQRDLLGMGMIAAETTAELIPSDRSRCLFYNAEEGALWTETQAGEADQEFSDEQGIAGFAARSGTPRVAQIAQADGLYLRDIDDPHGNGHERILAQPVRTVSGETHAVIVIVRDGTRPEFTAQDCELLALWAEHAAPLFHMHYLEAVAQEIGQAQGSDVAELFRPEALAAHREGVAADGDPLVSAPRWTKGAHLIVLLCVIAMAAFGIFARVGQYATGPAIVVSSGHRDVTAVEGGVLSRILASPGDIVRKGDVVAELSADAERADLTRVQNDLDRELAARLRDPTDVTLEQRVAALNVELERAKERLQQKLIVAPDDGRVGDLRSTEGQAVQPGQVVVTLVTGNETPKVQAFVPGRHRPAMDVGQELILDVEGFAHASQHLTVNAVGDEVLGPAEIARIIGPQLADAIQVGGGAVMVEADLHDATIEADGQLWTLHDGMTGKADVKLQKERVIFALFPRLKDLMPYD